MRWRQEIERRVGYDAPQHYKCAFSIKKKELYLVRDLCEMIDVTVLPIKRAVRVKGKFERDARTGTVAGLSRGALPTYHNQRDSLYHHTPRFFAHRIQKKAWKRSS